MRKFQKAALAGATAVAVAFGSTAVATAEDQPSAQPNNGLPTKTVEATNNKDASSSFKAGQTLGATEKDKDGNTQLNGTTYNAFFAKDETWKDQAPIYKLLFVGGIATFVSALVGLVFGPAYNFFVHGPSF